MVTVICTKEYLLLVFCYDADCNVWLFPEAISGAAMVSEQPEASNNHAAFRHISGRVSPNKGIL